MPLVFYIGLFVMIILDVGTSDVFCWSLLEKGILYNVIVVD